MASLLSQTTTTLFLLHHPSSPFKVLSLITQFLHAYTQTHALTHLLVLHRWTWEILSQTPSPCHFWQFLWKANWVIDNWWFWAELLRLHCLLLLRGFGWTIWGRNRVRERIGREREGVMQLGKEGVVGLGWGVRNRGPVLVLESDSKVDRLRFTVEFPSCEGLLEVTINLMAVVVNVIILVWRVLCCSGLNL